MASIASARVDLEDAQRQLDDGKSVREVAAAYGVTTQAIYDLVRRGKLDRPAPAG